MTFDIFTDTSANLPKELVKKYDIHVLPFTFTYNGADYRCMDPENFDGHEFFEMMRQGVEVVTTQINPQIYMDGFEASLSQGKDILYVSMSSGISGAFNSSKIAAAELAPKYPERKIHLIDTIGASLGEGLLALIAAEYREAGMELDPIAEMLDGLRHRMYNVFTVDELKYLRRTGRLSNAAAVIGTVLHIKPILKGDVNGKIVSFLKVRGRKKAIETLAERYDALVENAGGQMVGIAHADCEADADALIALLNRNHPPKEILKVVYEPVTGSHVGPGTLALFFLAKEGCRLQ